MSHVEQKEAIKITNHEVGILPNNVPVVDQFLNNYCTTHKACPIKIMASNSSLMSNGNSMHMHRSVEDPPYTLPIRNFH